MCGKAGGGVVIGDGDTLSKVKRRRVITLILFKIIIPVSIFSSVICRADSISGL